MNKVELSHLEGTTKVPGQKENAENSEPGMTDTSGNASSIATASESQSLAIERSGSGERGASEGSHSLPARRATGPRTPEGKQRSKYNALKHGIFSSIVLLKDESRSEFNSLLNRLRNDLRPEGALEELLVEKLAALAWRQRRLLLAESAEIQSNKEAEKIVEVLGPGLIRKIRNPKVLGRCLELLAELRKQVEKESYTKYENPILVEIYGIDDKEKHLCGNLYNSYREWVCAAKSSGEERGRGGDASLKQCRLDVLYEVDQETRRLKRYQEACTSIETTRTQPEVLRHNVPEAPAADPLLRYEASLDRSFDRTLTQLERLQRMRRGQPVPPPLKVDVSGLEAGPIGPDARR